MTRIPKKLLDRISKEKGKRARFVLDAIVKNGKVSMEEITAAGYAHAARAVADVRDLGYVLKNSVGRDHNGRRMAVYALDIEACTGSGTRARQNISKSLKEAVLTNASHRCEICSAEHNLQADHRVPYRVQEGTGEANEFQALCGSCNRSKSWACEHCENWLR